MAWLFVIQGRDQGRRFELGAETATVGRDRTNQVQLHDTEVSRRHAEIRREEEGFALIDHQSSNGSFVNSQRVERRILKTGDRILFGRTLLTFTDSADSPGSSHALRAVDIVGHAGSRDASRIVKSIGQEEGQSLLSGNEEPWLARARSNLQVMYRTALAVSHTLDIDQLLQRILELIFEWVEADRGCIMLTDRESGELLPKARRTRQGVDADERILISRTILDYVMERKEGVPTSDAQEDQRWDAAGSILKLGVREAICVPMQGRYGIVGVIYIDTYTPPGRFIQRAPNRFADEHLKLMIAIAHQAALAVEDTSYYSAMVQAERLAAVGQTIATLSHHIKNILQGIRGGSYLIEEGLKGHDNEFVQKGWRIVEKNQERISNLVMDMLSFSKERLPELDPARINEVVADVVELLQMRAADAEVRLECRLDPNLGESAFDSEGLHRAVLNVATNAIDACEKRPSAEVIVSTRLDTAAGAVQVVVADNGEGIAPEDMEKIFNVFESRKGNRGTGLGLPVSQKILREHGGGINLTSELGKGTEFVLWFPLLAADSPQSSFETLG